MTYATGPAFLSSPLSYIFAIDGVIVWLALVMLIGGIASFLPAWSASRVTVRQVLAYEG